MSRVESVVQFGQRYRWSHVLWRIFVCKDQLRLDYKGFRSCIDSTITSTKKLLEALSASQDKEHCEANIYSVKVYVLFQSLTTFLMTGRLVGYLELIPLGGDFATWPAFRNKRASFFLIVLGIEPSDFTKVSYSVIQSTWATSAFILHGPRLPAKAQADSRSEAELGTISNGKVLWLSFLLFLSFFLPFFTCLFCFAHIHLLNWNYGI